MFKKAFTVQQQTLVNAKDRKTLQANLQKAFNKEVLEEFFKDNKNIQTEKLKGSKQILYTTDSYPAFVDATGKGDFFPSLYVVSEYPCLLEVLKIKPGIENLVLGGANVVWEGVSNAAELKNFKKDDVCQIVSPEGNLIALGALGSDSKDIKANEPACYVLHTIKDALWEYGPKSLIPAKEQFKTNAGKQNPPAKQEQQQQQQQQVLPKEQQKKDESSSDENEEDLTLFMGGLKGAKSQQQPKKQTKQPVQVQKKEFEDSDEDLKGKKKKKGKGKPKGKGKQEDKESDEEVEQKPTKNDQKQVTKQTNQEESKEAPLIPLKVMDEYINEAFMNAIKVGISEKDLPISAQDFYQNYMVQLKRQNIELDFKNSTYGKIGKFLLLKKKDEIIDYKEAKKGGQPMLVSVDRNNEIYEDWNPTVTSGHKAEVEEKGGKSQSKGNQSTIEIVELYRPDAQIVALFGKQDLLTKEEIKKIVLNYMKAQDPGKKKNSMDISKDKIFSQFLHQEQEDEEPAEGEEEQQKQEEQQKKEEKQGKTKGDSKKEQTGARKKKLPKDGIVSEDILLSIQGEFKGLQIIAEKQHNKSVTVIQGLETFGFYYKTDAKIKPEKEKKVEQKLDEEDNLETQDQHEKTQQLEQQPDQQQEVNHQGDVPTKAEGQQKPDPKSDSIYTFQYVLKVLLEKLECLGAIHELPGKNAGRQIILQGLFVDETIDYFTKEYKINPDYVHEVNKIAAKKKPTTFNV